MNHIPFQDWTEQTSQLALPLTDARGPAHGEQAFLGAKNEPDPPSNNRKMAIPRLAEGSESTFTSPGRFHRRHVSRACESCRQRKTKCTGDKNGCRNCREAGIICCYTDGKREKSKRQLASLEAKLEQYEHAFSRLGYRFNVSTEQLMSLASSMETTSEPSQQSNPFSSETRNSFRMPEPHQTHHIFEHISEDFNIEHISEDFNKDPVTQATGYIGGTSEISWLQMLTREIDHGDPPNNPGVIVQPQSLGSSPHLPISKLSYHLDDWDLPSALEGGKYELPGRETAKRLYQMYLDSVHSSFPIIGTSTFGAQFQSFYNNSSLKPGNKWLAILNLIFAIGSSYCQLIGASGELDMEAHHLYFSRARALSIDERVLDHLDLQQIQVEGLAALYLLASGHVNRSWKVCGDAVRGAMSLGLHLRIKGSFASDISKEIRYRVWWSLYVIEHRLSLMMGRPSCITDSVCTTPLPVPFDEDDFKHEEVQRMIRRGGSSNQSGGASGPMVEPEINDPSTDLRGSKLAAVSPRGSLYFLQVVGLVSISKRMMLKLYNPEGKQATRPSKEFIIRGLSIDMDSWYMGLPKEYDFTSTSTSTKTPQSLANQRTSLALLFYSTKIGITRPCLEDSDSLHESDRNSKVHDFYRKTAVECVEAACHLLRLFPEPVDAAALYKVSPWWCVLHFLMQATAVIYLELAYGSQHVPEKVEMVNNAATKSFEWLVNMSKTSQTSRKARKLCERFLNLLGLQLDSNMLSDEESEDEQMEHAQTDKIGSSSLTAQLKRSPDNTSSSEVDPPESSSAAETDKQPPDGPISYEEGFLPYDPNTGQITGSFFPGEGTPDISSFGYYWNEST